MKDQKVRKYYNEQYNSPIQSERIRLPWLSFLSDDYYGKPLRLLDVQRGKKLLDIACGSGQLLKRAEDLGLKCWGIDISEIAIREARKTVEGELVCSDVNNGLPYNDNSFDYITCLGSLEHFENQYIVIREIFRIAKKTCLIYFLVPNDNYILHKFGYETDYQPVVNRYSFKEYQILLERNGLKIYRTLRDNPHLTNLSESSSIYKLFAKLMFRPLVSLIPFPLSYNFIFLCSPNYQFGNIDRL